MTNALTPEENGRKVLDIYKNFDTEENHVLRANNFVAVAARRNWSIRHLTEGLGYAVEHGWVEKLPNGGLKLTVKGREEM